MFKPFYLSDLSYKRTLFAIRKNRALVIHKMSPLVYLQAKDRSGKTEIDFLIC